MITICLDTNAFQKNWFAQGEAFRLIADFISKDEARAYVSEITVQEHAAHYRQEAPIIVKDSVSQLAELKQLLMEAPIPALPKLTDTAKFEPSFRKRLLELGITVLPIPAVAHAALVARDLSQIRPFDKKGRGYRDSLIWLGLLKALDHTTTRVALVTTNKADFCATDNPGALHPDLAKELQEHAPGCKATVHPTPTELVESVVKPRLKAIAEVEAATQDILQRIQTGTYEHFTITQVVTDGLDNFAAQEPTGTFCVGGEQLEEPLWVTFMEAPENIEATDIFRLNDNTYVCEGTADVTITLEGYLDKFEAANQAALGNAYITEPDWNEHYAEVEVSDVPATITFSINFDDQTGTVASFEIIKIEPQE